GREIFSKKSFQPRGLPGDIRSPRNDPGTIDRFASRPYSLSRKEKNPCDQTVPREPSQTQRRRSRTRQAEGRSRASARVRARSVSNSGETYRKCGRGTGGARGSSGTTIG